MSQSGPSPTRPISRTSIYVAAGRAVGARDPDPTVRNPDYLAEKLLGDPSGLNLDHPAVRALSLSYDEAMRDAEVVSNVRMMTVRTRFIDEALERSLAGGATQVVILGAGFDSHAYRFQDRLAHARVFEVDRPATQALKRQRVREVLGRPPANLAYVAIDFRHEDLPSVLAQHGHDPAHRTFFILEGVTMYLTAASVRQTLQFVGGHAPGSGLVFDFVPRAMVEMLAGLDLAHVPAAARPFLQRFLDLIKDEPWQFGIPLGGERAFLAEFGIELREVLTIGGEESLKRYLTKADGTQVGAQAIADAMARMGPAVVEPSSPEAHAARERMREQQRSMAYQLAEAAVAPKA